MKEKLEEIRNSAVTEADKADSLDELENIKVKYLGIKVN
jgi:hypothetical protein